jgi:hypothetical protein
VVKAVDQVSGRPVPVPKGLTVAKDRPIFWLSGSDLLVWNSDSGPHAGTLRVWRSRLNRSLTVLSSPTTWPTAQRLGMSFPTYPAVYQHFLVWDAGGVFVLDLDTNSFAQIGPAAHGGGVLLGGSWLATAPTTQRQVNKPDRPRDEYLFDLHGLPHLPRC